MSGARTGWKQDFFKDVPPILMTDPLAAILGAVEDGAVIEYRFEDCVRLAGHACASVASAFMMTRKALEALYQGALPERGGIEVRFAGGKSEGANGPIGQVIGFITGAATETGFRGLGGQFGRYNMLQYDERMEGRPGAITALFRRVDTGEAVLVCAQPSLIPMTPEEREGASHMPSAVHGAATPQERESFLRFWQGRNRKILLENHEGVFQVERA
jgi:hypothetical protein